MTDSSTTQTQHINTFDDTPSIYVACLAAYNHAILHGAWIDATQEPDAIKEAIQAMLKASPIAEAEEYAIHDYDNFHSIRQGLPLAQIRLSPDALALGYDGWLLQFFADGKVWRILS